MTIKNKYYRWICSLIEDYKPCQEESYHRLLSLLDEIPYFYTIPMDENRYDDGISLRYNFGYETGYDNEIISEKLGDKSCSFLEMLVALACKCEQIMSDPEYGDRTGKWFWGMITNLGLEDMTDEYFDEQFVEDTVNDFMNFRYAPDGRGGLFYVKNPPRDMRDTEIWYQAMWYLNKELADERK